MISLEDSSDSAGRSKNKKKQKKDDSSSVFPYAVLSKFSTFNRITADISERLSNRNNYFSPSGLEWFRSPPSPSVFRYNEFSIPPYVVLVESTRHGNNISKLDPFVVTDMIAIVVPMDKRKIYRSGINQIKVFCVDWSDANKLADSLELKNLRL